MKSYVIPQQYDTSSNSTAAVDQHVATASSTTAVVCTWYSIRIYQLYQL